MDMVNICVGLNKYAVLEMGEECANEFYGNGRKEFIYIGGSGVVYISVAHECYLPL